MARPLVWHLRHVWVHYYLPMGRLWKHCHPMGQNLPMDRHPMGRLLLYCLPKEDYSYRTSRDGGRGWILVGDALGFIDPIYSTGLYLAMQSAELATGAITTALGDGEETPSFTGFSRVYQAAFDQFYVLVRAFYSDHVRFGELAKNADHRQGLVDMLTGVTTTAQAINVTNVLRASLGEQTPSMMPGSPARRPR